MTLMLRRAAGWAPARLKRFARGVWEPAPLRAFKADRWSPDAVSFPGGGAILVHRLPEHELYEPVIFQADGSIVIGDPSSQEPSLPQPPVPDPADPPSPPAPIDPAQAVYSSGVFLPESEVYV